MLPISAWSANLSLSVSLDLTSVRVQLSHNKKGHIPALYFNEGDSIIDRVQENVHHDMLFNCILPLK